MRVFKNTVLLAAGAMLAVAAPVWAQQAGAHPANSAAGVNQRAADLINTVNQGEIATGQMMQSRSQNDQVKGFAKMLVDDHQDAQNKLESVASQDNINLQAAAPMQRQNQNLKQRLQNEDPAQADKSYVASEVRDHRMAIRSLQRMEPNVTDPQLKSYIQSTIPILQKHLAEARKLQTQLGKPGE